MVFFSIAATDDHDHWQRGKRLKHQSQNPITKRLEHLILLRFLTCALAIVSSWLLLLSSSSSSSSSWYQRQIHLTREVVDVLLWLGFVLELSWRLVRRSSAFPHLLDKVRTIQKKIQRQSWFAVFPAMRNRFCQTREQICKKRSTWKAVLGGGRFRTCDSICSVGRNWIMDRISTWLYHHTWSPMRQQQDAVSKEVQLCGTVGPALAPPQSSIERLEANYYHDEDQHFVSMTNKKKG